MCLLGLALMTLGGLLMGLAETYALATIGGVIINVLLTKMVADWFAGPEMMTAMALFVISWPVGIGLGLLTLGPLAATTGWPLVMHVTAAICAISLVLVALCYHPPAGAAKPTGAGSLASMFRLGFTGRELDLVLLAGTLWSLFNVSFILVVSFAPDFLTAAGHSQTDAGGVVSIAAWLTVIMGPMGGLLAERSGRPGMILAVSLTRFGAAVAAMTVWDAPIPSFAIMGIIGGLAPGIIMALPARWFVRRFLHRPWGFILLAITPAWPRYRRRLAGSATPPARPTHRCCWPPAFYSRHFSHFSFSLGWRGIDFRPDWFSLELDRHIFRTLWLANFGPGLLCFGSIGLPINRMNGRRCVLAGTNSQGGIIDGDKLSSLVDSKRGTIDRRIYSDPDIYKLELERIFARAWNFMCHESQIPNTGDYFINFIGEDQVIVVRDNDGAVQVLLNTCRHRGNALCRAEQGNTKSFVCSYHGWNYGLDGRLLGIPGQKNFYRDQIDPAEWGLVKAAKVDDYKGFYFATLDPGAPDLHDFLGDVGRTGMEVLLAQGEVVAVDGVQKNIIDCNWKIAVDNLFDWYHVKISHRSAAKAGFLNPRMMMPMDQMVMLGEYGHAIGGPMISEAQQAEIDQLSDEERADIDLLSDAERAKLAPRINERRPVRKKATAEAMGPVGVRASGHPNIFPNLWISTRGMQVSLRLPRGPFETEVWWFTFMPKKFTPDQRRGAMKFISHSFGPAGLLEQDDGENWSQSTQSSRGVVSGRIPHNMQMGLGQDEVLEHPLGQKRIETRVNEHAQRWTYKCWAEWLRADDWDDLMAMRSPSPTGRI